MRDVYDEIRAERARAHAKHGSTSMEVQPVTDPAGFRRDIITEELGEVAREFNEARHDGRPVHLGRLRDELIQVAAMAAAWADNIAGSTLATVLPVDMPDSLASEDIRKGAPVRIVDQEWNGVVIGHPYEDGRGVLRVLVRYEPAQPGPRWVGRLRVDRLVRRDT